MLPDAVAGLAGRLAGRDPGDGAGGHDRSRAGPRDLRHCRPTSSPVTPPRRRRCGHLRFEHVDFTFPGVRAPRSCGTSTSASLRARPSRWSGPPGRARRRSPRWSHVSTTSPAVGSPSTASTSATAALEQLRSLVATAFEEPTLFSMSARENLTLGRRRRHRGARSPRRVDIAQAGSSTSCRGASRPASGSRACRCRVASASASPSRAPYSPARRCWCSTTRCPRSTSTPRSWSRRRCGGCSARPPRSSSPTGPPPCCWPTGSRCWTTAGSPTSATTAAARHGARLPRAAGRRRRRARGSSRMSTPRSRPPRPPSQAWRGTHPADGRRWSGVTARWTPTRCQTTAAAPAGRGGCSRDLLRPTAG